MRLRIFTLVCVAALTACGGGGGGGGSVTPGGTGGGSCPSGTTGTPPNCTAPSSGSTSVTTSSTSPSSATLPAVGGFSGTLQLPPASTAATLNVTESTTAPSGVPALQSVGRRPQSTGNTPYLYFSVTTSTAVQLNGLPALTLTLPNSVSAKQAFYVAAYIPGNGWTTFAGPALVSGSTVTLSSEPGTITMDAGTTIVFAFYAGSALNGYNPISTSPAQVQLLDTTASQTVTITDSAPSASLTVDGSACNGVANVTSQSATTFKVSAVAVGTCTVKVRDSYSNTLDVPVSVTSTTVTPQ